MKDFRATDRDGTRTAPAVNPTWSINELLVRRPAAVAVLNAYGLDTCCGGASSLADAAREAGADLWALLADVEAESAA
jgi:iron-sulfur cluster repair protein YtfE (RIC family)